MTILIQLCFKYLYRTCIFCEEQNDMFTPEGLDRHYDKDCPMLLRCSNCKQVCIFNNTIKFIFQKI